MSNTGQSHLGDDITYLDDVITESQSGTAGGI